jgi:hypothetical protein
MRTVTAQLSYKRADSQPLAHSVGDEAAPWYDPYDMQFLEMMDATALRLASLVVAASGGARGERMPSNIC